MRAKECHDLHEKRTFTMKVDEGSRVALPSTSWLAACAQITDCMDNRVLKAVKHLLPSRERMVNMAIGSRDTTNVGTALYPGRGNIVRVARYQARVDEGTNQIDVINTEEVTETYGEMISCTSCVNHGEAFLVVYNNTDRALYLPGGLLKLRVTPVLSLPICSTASTEFKQLKEKFSRKPTPKSEGKRMPRTIVTWSCDGLTERITHGDLNAFYHEIKEFTPDVITLQQIKWRADPQDHTKVCPETEDEKNYALLEEALSPHYHIYLNLSERPYGGQMTLAHKDCHQPQLSYSLSEELGRDISGRITKLIYSDMDIWSIWAPTLGKKDPQRLARREKWDKNLWKALNTDPVRHKIVVGNFQAVLEDHQMSRTPNYWLRKCQNPNLLGLRDESQDIGDEGYPTTTANERTRLAEGMANAFLKDPQSKRARSRPQFTWQGEKKDQQLVTTYTLVSNSILQSGGVEANTTIEPVKALDPFLGSSNRPMWLSLKENWKAKAMENDEDRMKYGVEGID